MTLALLMMVGPGKLMVVTRPGSGYGADWREPGQTTTGADLGGGS